MESKRITRRRFFKHSMLGAAGTSLACSVNPFGMRLTAADKVNVGVIGAGIRGLELMGSALRVGGNVAVVCDLYDGHFRRAKEIQPGTPTTREYREVLDRKDIDAVFIAATDHWHAPIAVAAMQAGKDVYVEKPMTHKIPEALEMVKVTKATRRVVQVGSQSLSVTSTQKGKEVVESGQIGTVRMVQASLYRPSAVGAWRYPVPHDASPQTVDWARFLGNAPLRDFDARRFFQFRNWWDYGTGIAGDEYVHLLSRVHYVMGVQYPLSAVSNGGIYHWTGDREVPDIHNTLYDYGKFQVVVTTNLVSNWDPGEIVRFMGDKGTLELGPWGATLVPYNPAENYLYPLSSWPKDTKQQFIEAHKDDPLADVGIAAKQPKRQKEFYAHRAEGTEDHIQNFFDCVKSRQRPIEDVEFGCGTAVACHMANISYQEKKRVFWDAKSLDLRRET